MGVKVTLSIVYAKDKLLSAGFTVFVHVVPPVGANFPCRNNQKTKRPRRIRPANTKIVVTGLPTVKFISLKNCQLTIKMARMITPRMMAKMAARNGESFLQTMFILEPEAVT
jgi:hypothetical protein